MKINKKALDLVEVGLKPDTVAKMSESQINILHSKMISEQVTSEQVTEVPGKTTYKVGPQGGKIGNMTLSLDPNKKEVMVTTEIEMTEQPDTDISTMDKTAGGTTQDPVQVQGPDGMGDLGDKQIDKEKEISEKKENKSNPYAICHAQLGPKKTKKFERCVKQVKKSIQEGNNPLSLFIEAKIMELVSKHIPPRMTKGELMKHLVEDGPAVAPSKPETRPTTKPKPGTKPKKPSHPLKNPNPGEKPAPKAEYEKAKSEVLNLIKNILDK